MQPEPEPCAGYWYVGNIFNHSSPLGPEVDYSVKGKWRVRPFGSASRSYMLAATSDLTCKKDALVAVHGTSPGGTRLRDCVVKSLKSDALLSASFPIRGFMPAGACQSSHW